jgi:hypothetical protein
LVDALDLGSSVERRGGSTPSARTMFEHWRARPTSMNIPAQAITFSGLKIDEDG